MTGLLSRELDYNCGRLDLPAVDRGLPIDTEVEFPGFLGTDGPAAPRTGKSVPVESIGQFIIADNRSLALLGAKQ